MNTPVDQVGLAPYWLLCAIAAGAMMLADYWLTLWAVGWVRLWPRAGRRLAAAGGVLLCWALSMAVILHLLIPVYVPPAAAVRAGSPVAQFDEGIILQSATVAPVTPHPGDTVTVQTATEKMKVRLLGVDAPEIAHGSSPADCGGPQAAAALRALVKGRKVTLSTDAHTDRHDRFGRVLGYLDDGTMIVVEAGAAMVGSRVSTEVTSVLQSPSGKMIFARLVS